MLQNFPTYTELIGNDVNLIHRLTKNSVVEAIGLKAYILFTQAAFERLGVREEREQMVYHRENFKHYGEVGIIVRDMHALREKEQGRVRTSVKQEDAAITIEERFPVHQGLMWDYLTKPEYKAILTNSTSAILDNRNNGRNGKGTIYHCAHGNSTSSYTIVDWQPPHEYPNVGDPFLGCTTHITTRLISEGESTKVQLLYSEFQGGFLPVRIFLKYVLGALVKFGGGKLMQKLLQKIEAEIENGAMILPIENAIPTDEMIAKAVTEGLADP